MRCPSKTAKIWLSVAIGSAALGIISGVLAIIFASKLMYVPMAIFLIVAAHGFYGSPFYFLAFKNAKLLAAVNAALCEKKSLTAEEISVLTNYKQEYAVRFIAKYLSKGLFAGYMLEDGVLKKEENEK